MLLAIKYTYFIQYLLIFINNLFILLHIYKWYLFIFPLTIYGKTIMPYGKLAACLNSQRPYVHMALVDQGHHTDMSRKKKKISQVKTLPVPVQTI